MHSRWSKRTYAHDNMVHKIGTCLVVTKCPKTVENESRQEGIGQIVKSPKSIYI